MTFGEQWTERRTFVLNDNEIVRVTVHGATIVGFIGDRIVSQFDTSGVQDHKIEWVAQQVLSAMADHATEAVASTPSIERQGAQMRDRKGMAEHLARDCTRVMEVPVSAAQALAVLEMIEGNGHEVASHGHCEIVEKLTVQCPDCLGAMTVGDGDYEEGCETCVWGRVPAPTTAHPSDSGGAP